jgi:hypothetical protein
VHCTRASRTRMAASDLSSSGSAPLFSSLLPRIHLMKRSCRERRERPVSAAEPRVYLHVAILTRGEARRSANLHFWPWERACRRGWASAKIHCTMSQRPAPPPRPDPSHPEDTLRDAPPSFRSAVARTLALWSGLVHLPLEPRGGAVYPSRGPEVGFRRTSQCELHGSMPARSSNAHLSR